MFSLQVYVSGAVESWTVAGAFGQRRFVAVTVLLGDRHWRRTLGQARHTTRPCGLRDSAGRVPCGGTSASPRGSALGLMDRQRLELARNAYDVFVTIPAWRRRLPARYLTNRDSLYRDQGTRLPRAR